MELRAFAERVLYGAVLDDKLGPPDGWTDHAPGPGCAVPEAPGRPAALALRRLASRPTPRSITSDEDRGRLLHAFANHELLALELFALALLRFPDADPRLRMGWAATAADEQRHLAAYLARMAACGVALGEQPVSAFFWDALSTTPDADTFTVGMGLVLEQANLDFARYWAAAFEQAGDGLTAAVLRGVQLDEIRHVRLASRHLDAIRFPEESAFDAFTRHLRFPLTAARARGPEPDREARLRAGLPPAFVEAVLVAGESRGRTPRLFTFDPGAEDELAGRAADRGVAHDLAAIPILLAAADDVVVAPRPSVGFLRTLVDAGFPMPQVIERPEPASIPNGRVRELRPWARTPRASAALAAFGHPPFDPRAAVTFDKAWGAERAREFQLSIPVPTDPADVGVVCRTVDEVERACADGDRWIKAGLSTAGGHRLRVAQWDERARTWVERALGWGPVVVEPHLDVVAELSVQGELDPTVKILGVTRFGCARGVYRGSIVGPADAGLGPEVRRFVNSPRAGAVFDVLREAARTLGTAAAAAGLVGPFGVDALVVRGASGLRLKPIGELNPRTTMGRVAWGMRRRLAPGSVGAWLFVPARAWPAPEPYIERGPHGLEAGVVPTTEGGTRVHTALVVDRDFDALVARCEALADRAADPARARAALGWLRTP